MPATTATSRRAPAKPKVAARRRELCDERLKLEAKLAGDYKRMAELDTELKNIATDAGEPFKEEFAIGYVAVAGKVAAELKGNVPVIQSEIFLALPAAERKKLEKSGLVKIEPQWGKASHGRVTVKVF